MEKDFQKLQNEPWRVLEFYSGIGGMRYSVLSAGIDANVVQAFDINDVANDVYQHNFGDRPYQGNIESLTAADMDSYQADVWLLSPPCQPYTRQGLQKHSGDARALSFLKILELMLQASRPPVMLFAENVVGFETSDTHTKMIEMLEKADFSRQEFILSPMQFGVPYSRPRYFCLAKRRPLSFKRQLYNNQLLLSPSPLLENDAGLEIIENHQETSDKLLDCEPICRFLDKSIEFSFSDASSILREGALEKTKDADELDIGSFDRYVVPSSLIDRWGSAMDIVYPDSRRCCCFTKSYYRYVKGTGSLLAPFEFRIFGLASCECRTILIGTVACIKHGVFQRVFLTYKCYRGGKDGAHSLKEQKLRYFTPREVANLHSFPADFQFPQHIGLRQRYALVGNSLSIAVVAPLLRYLFAEPILLIILRHCYSIPSNPASSHGLRKL